jgi:hypothetical protein
MCDQILHGVAWPGHLRRQPEHLDVALVADRNPCRFVIHNQALRNIVDGGVETFLLHVMLLRQLADDEKQHACDHEHREAGCGDQIAELFPPIGQRSRYRRGRDDDDREFGQCTSRGQSA